MTDLDLLRAVYGKMLAIGNGQEKARDVVAIVATEMRNRCVSEILQAGMDDEARIVAMQALDAMKVPCQAIALPIRGLAEKP